METRHIHEPFFTVLCVSLWSVIWSCRDVCTPLLGLFLKKKKNSWLLGKMFESGFPDASGREEG